jgi:hypothetical protein
MRSARVKKSLGLVGTMALLVLLAGCSSAASVDTPDPTRAASSLAERIGGGVLEYRVRGCLTNRTDETIDYVFQPDSRQMNGKPLPGRAPERFGTMGPGVFLCAYSPVSFEPSLSVEVVIGAGRAGDDLRIESLGGGYFGVQCSISGFETVPYDVAVQLNCGNRGDYPTTAGFDGNVASVNGIPTYTINWNILPKP